MYMDISELFPTPQHLFQYRNLIPTLELYTQKHLWTVKTRFYIVEMFLGPRQSTVSADAALYLFSLTLTLNP